MNPTNSKRVGPGRSPSGKLICLCRWNRTYCPHRAPECPVADLEPQDPTWTAVDRQGREQKL